MSNIIRIAIDGPSGAGKSTIAKNIAKNLGIDYIDTGAMYRAIAYKVIKNQIDLNCSQNILQMLENTDIDFKNGDIILDGEIINEKIRTPEVSEMASVVAAIQVVREKLISIQRNMGQAKSVVMDGRDIGTNVFTDAEFKFYITASTEERAKRRWQELNEIGEKVELYKVEADIIQRDRNDSTRTINPLSKAEDAIELDTTEMSVEEVIQTILKAVNR